MLSIEFLVLSKANLRFLRRKTDQKAKREGRTRILEIVSISATGARLPYPEFTSFQLDSKPKNPKNAKIESEKLFQRTSYEDEEPWLVKVENSKCKWNENHLKRSTTSLRNGNNEVRMINNEDEKTYYDFELQDIPVINSRNILGQHYNFFMGSMEVIERIEYVDFFIRLLWQIAASSAEQNLQIFFLVFVFTAPRCLQQVI